MKLKKLIKLNDIFYFRKHIYINLINRYRSHNLTKNRLNFLKNYDKKQLRFYFNCFVNFYIKFNFYNKSLFLHENFIFKLNFFFDFNYKDLLLIILKSDLKKYFYEIIFYKNFIFFNLFLIFKKLNLCFMRYCDFLEQNNLYFQIKEKIILKKIYYRNYSIYYYKNLMGFYNNKYYNFDNIFPRL